MSKYSIFYFLSVCVIASCLLTACSNTINGAGKDIEKAGQAIQKTMNE